jgi:hypothetical protein
MDIWYLPALMQQHLAWQQQQQQEEVVQRCVAQT